MKGETHQISKKNKKIKNKKRTKKGFFLLFWGLVFFCLGLGFSLFSFVLGFW
jgi:hypothetical protein